MKSLSSGFISGEEGKGTLGCLFSILLMAIVLFLAFKLAPVYFNHYEFKGDMKQAVSRIGVRAIAEDVIIQDLIKTAEKNNITIEKENIKIRRFSGQVYISIEYTVPVNFLIMKHDLHFELEESSFSMI